MSRSAPRAPSTLFIVGICLVVAALALAIGAVRFEFAYAGVTTDLAGVDWVLDYATLTTADRALVDAAIAGDRYVTDSLGALPGPGRGSLAVSIDGEYHAFTRRTFFDPGTNYGVASLASASSGVGAIVLAFRNRERNNPRYSTPY
jgi:hypothetical protein